jgi:hypothetical protein
MGFVILTAKPIAGHGTEASGGSSGQDDPAAAGASAWIRAGDRRQSWIIGVPRTLADGHAGNAAAEPTATAQQ